MDQIDLSKLKLYECRYEVIYYVMAENPREASTYLHDAVDNDPFENLDVSVHQFHPVKNSIDERWQLGCLVYGKAPDGFSLNDAVELIKNRAKNEQQMEFPFVKEIDNVETL